MAPLDKDTICAIATATGRGGIGIIRISGPATKSILEKFCSHLPQPRMATFSQFRDEDGEVLDEGIVLFFPGPHSFTGEDVAELQGHGGTQILKLMLQQTLNFGARLARPGEFSERAFLNDKLDLLQAEAIADLVDASSAQAARSALRTLQGVFSARVHELNGLLTKIRVNVEAAIDFSDEDIDVLGEQQVATDLSHSCELLQTLLAEARQGALLQEGLNVVIAGQPNTGKSSLLNALAGNEMAIVTDIPGTTRDLLSQQLQLDGLPLHVTDTAGLRCSTDLVEQEGVRRARDAINKADLILLLVDATRFDGSLATHLQLVQESADEETTADQQLLHRICLVVNKIDLVTTLSPGQGSTAYQEHALPTFHISAQQGSGLDALRGYLQSSCGYQAAGENAFSARERHLRALESAGQALNSAISGVSEHLQLELIAEDLRSAQGNLGSITGQVSSDDLLGEIFSSFCVGK